MILKIYHITTPFVNFCIISQNKHSQNILDLGTHRDQGWGLIPISPSARNIYQVQVLVKYSFFKTKSA